MIYPRLIRTLIFILPTFALAGFSVSKFIKTKVTNDISVSLPQEFFPMTPEDIGQRFPSVRAPLGAFTTEDRVVDFSVNISATQWPETDLAMTKSFFKAGIHNLYDRVDLIEEGIRDVHKKKFIFFEFESRSNPDRKQLGTDPQLKYTYIQYLVEPNRTLVFSFSCPRDRKQEWQEKAHQVMNSVRVR